MDNLDVALQGNDHQTEYSGRYTDNCQSCTFYSEAEDVVDSRVAVVHKAVSEQHHVHDSYVCTGEEIHRRLVDKNEDRPMRNRPNILNVPIS